MRTIKLKSALLADGWANDVILSISDDGLITGISRDSKQSADEAYELIGLPGMPNVHSHAFQRAFAGATEFRIEDRDSFWTWREKMFEFARSLTVDRVYEIALSLYSEMIRAGYTWVGEFHYLHDEQPTVDMHGTRVGQVRSDRREVVRGYAMCDAIVRAAKDAGIGLCLIPTLYQRGGLDDRPLADGQSRFHLEVSDWLRLVRDLERFLPGAGTIGSENPMVGNFQVGAAIHSLRAVDDAVGVNAIAELKRDRPEMPIHIHVAEQQAEVDDCIRQYGQRPIERLMDRYDVDETWCLIHCTQCDEIERQAIVDSGATVALCPTTEANLGDGLFPAAEFFAIDGRVAIGSDSHCSIDVREELRWFEYSQRYRARERAVLCLGSQSVGRTLYERCAENGGRSLGVKTGVLAVGYRADLVLVADTSSNGGSSLGADDLTLDRYIFCNHPGDNGPVRVMIGGCWRKG